ncbi:MAG: MFS transporter [Bacteroidales bacterium]|nr:MFS transporter [Bacteroidales bacterium]
MSGKSKIFNIINIKEGEGTLVFLPIIYSFFTGAALAFFVTSATSLFLSSFEREMLPLAFIAAGVLVWLSGLLYSYFQKKYKYTSVLTGGLLLLLVSVLVFLSLYIKTNSIITIFLLYAWIRVFAYMHAITFWGLAGRLFTLRQGKRVFGLITGGEVFASILSFFSVPFLLKIINTEDLLFISGAALILGFLMLIYIVRKFKNKLSDQKTKEVKQKIRTDKGKVVFLRNRYYKLFFLIAFLPIFAQYFVDFIFQAQAKIEFPVRESLTSFVGLFFGVSAIVEFILKTFVSGRLMNKYGMKFGLVAFPVMLAFSFALASIFGLFYGAVSLFFSFVSLGRLFTRAVRTSFNDPATQILYQPLPPEERIVFQNKVESGPKAYAGIAAGILLFAFTKISWFTLVYFSIFLLIFIFFWYKSATAIFKEYKQILQTVLLKKTGKKIKTVNEEIFEFLKNKAETLNDKTKDIVSYMCNSVFPYRKNLIFAEEKEINKKYKLKELIAFANSENQDEREKAAKLFEDFNIYKVEIFLTKLLTDENFNVRAQAILTAGKLKEPELFKYLFANLRIPEYHDIVFSAIINIGKKILPDLDKFFYTIEHIPDIQMSVIKITELIGGEKAKEILHTKINYTNKTVSNRIIDALSRLSFQAKRADISHLSIKLEDEIGNFVYITACLADLKKQFNENNDILRAVNHEKKNKTERIFTILSVLYDSKAIELIRTNLENIDSDSKGYALEIADIIISELHKKILAPIFDDIPESELVNKYKYSYPQERLSVKERLIDIINSDNSITVNYTKALAVNLLSSYKTDDVFQVLKANIIHPNLIIRESAAITLYNMEPEIFNHQAKLFKTKIKGFNDLIKKVTISEENQNLLVLEKLKLLRSLDIFSNLSYEKLTKFAVHSEEYTIKKGEKMNCEGEDKNTIYLCISGHIFDKERNIEIKEGKIISLYSKNGNINKLNFIADEPTFMFKGKIYLLNNLFAENIEFVEKLTKNIIHS